jgi:hypothetical protein
MLKYVEAFNIPLTTKLNPNRNQIFNSYRAVNAVRLGYRNQSVNIVYGNHRCLFLNPQATQKYTVLDVKAVVHKENARLGSINANFRTLLMPKHAANIFNFL